MNAVPQITIQQAVDYEVRSSWWAGYVPSLYLREVASRYFVWKGRRKFARYQRWSPTNIRISTKEVRE